MTSRAFISVPFLRIVSVWPHLRTLIAQGPSASETDLTGTDGWSLEKHRTLARSSNARLG